MNCFTHKPQDGYGIIYKYTSPSGKSYIGQTIYSMQQRAKNNGSGYKQCPAFYNAIQKYGLENFRKEILAELPVELLDEYEKYYIEKYNSIQPNGYNIKNGGKENYNERKKRSFIVVQYNLNKEQIAIYDSVIQAARANNVDYQAISAVLNKRRAHLNGYIYCYKGEPCPDVIDHKTHGRKTGQYDLNGNLLNIFPSANQAALSIGANSAAGRNIRSVCEGKRKTAYGYIWKYLD